MVVHGAENRYIQRYISIRIDIYKYLFLLLFYFLDNHAFSRRNQHHCPQFEGCAVEHGYELAVRLGDGVCAGAP